MNIFKQKKFVGMLIALLAVVSFGMMSLSVYAQTVNTSNSANAVVDQGETSLDDGTTGRVGVLSSNTAVGTVSCSEVTWTGSLTALYQANSNVLTITNSAGNATISTITATVTNSNYEFKYWTVGATQVTDTESHTLSDGVTITAVFEMKTGVIAVTVNISVDNGTNYNSVKIYGQDEISYYLNDNQIKINNTYYTATPDDGYAFRYWTINGSQVTASGTLSVSDGDTITVVAVCTETSFTVEISATNGSTDETSLTITGTDTLTYLLADFCIRINGNTIVASPEQNCIFSYWNVDGSKVTSNGTVTGLKDGDTVSVEAVCETVSGYNFATAGAISATSTNYEANTIYIISSIVGFQNFVTTVNNGWNFAGKTVYLTANLDCSSVSIYPIGMPANESGKSESITSFSGTFNGQGHTIKNLTIKGANYNKCDYRTGLFAKLTGIVSDLRMTGTTIYMPNYTKPILGQILGTVSIGAGTIAAEVYSATIQYCTIEATYITVDSQNTFSPENQDVYIGGICGYNSDSGATHITNCYVGDFYCRINECGLVKNCYIYALAPIACLQHCVVNYIDVKVYDNNGSLMNDNSRVHIDEFSYSNNASASNSTLISCSDDGWFNASGNVFVEAPTAHALLELNFDLSTTAGETGPTWYFKSGYNDNNPILREFMIWNENINISATNGSVDVETITTPSDLNTVSYSVDGNTITIFGETVTATPNTNYAFKNWNINGTDVEDGATGTLSVDSLSSNTIIAVFEENSNPTYTLTFNLGANSSYFALFECVDNDTTDEISITQVTDSKITITNIPKDSGYILKMSRTIDEYNHQIYKYKLIKSLREICTITCQFYDKSNNTIDYDALYYIKNYGVPGDGDYSADNTASSFDNDRYTTGLQTWNIVPEIAKKTYSPIYK